MTVELNKEIAQKVKRIAKEIDYTEDTVVNYIVKWWLEDCHKENKSYLCDEL